MADDLRVLDYLFASRLHESLHLSTRQYAPIVNSWVEEIGLDSANYGTHSMRRTKASLIYRWTKNLRAVELLLGHTKLERANMQNLTDPHNHVQVDFDRPALPRRDSCSRFGVGFSALKLLTFAREYEKVAMESAQVSVVRVFGTRSGLN